jgi:hypothetical protein
VNTPGCGDSLQHADEEQRRSYIGKCSGSSADLLKAALRTLKALNENNVSLLRMDHPSRHDGELNLIHRRPIHL